MSGLASRRRPAGRMPRPGLLVLALAFVPLASLSACGGGGDGGPDAPQVDAPQLIDAVVATPFFPADYEAAGYAEVRNCRGSGDHELSQIRVLGSPDAIDAYLARTAPIPAGAVLLKEEYDFQDDTCTGPIVQFAVALRDPTSIETLGWRWQRVSVDREVVSSDDSRCIGCHIDCGEPGSEPFDHTCTVPP